MKLPEHVDKIRNFIESAFDKQFARLGIGKTKKLDMEKLPEEIRPKRLHFEEMLESHIGETGDYEPAREKLIDELTFTLFNRMAALKVMEAATLFPPVLTKQPEHGDRSFGHKAWLEINPHMRDEELEGIREYLKAAFDELGQTLPLYSRTYPYALFPDTISLNEIIDVFNAVEKDTQVGSDIWQSDDVLGWMYESYNNVKKKAHKENKAKTEYHKVSLQSQIYTPRWVVQFLVENSLGKLYLEMYPDSEIKNYYKIANAPQTQERSPKALHEVKIIDPACGSGNFLLYAFDFFYALYIDQIENYGADYEETDIPKLIIENNLHGIDLDDRAVQLAQLGLFIKAKKRRRNIGAISFNVVSSDFFLPEYEAVQHIFTEGTKLDQNQRELISEIWNDLKYAYKFGSLIQVDERLSARFKEIEDQAKDDLFGQENLESYRIFAATFFENLKTAVEQYGRSQGSTFLTSKTRDAITFLRLITTEYDVATANPPYTDSSNFGMELKKFIEDNYKRPYKFHTNLYATFIKRCYDFIGNTGFVAMVHPPTFMYIKTFEDVRKFIIDKTHINFFVEWGYLGMFNPSARVDSALYILTKGNKQEKDAVFIKLNHLYESKRYDALFDSYGKFLTGSKHELLYTIPQSKLKIIKSWPFIYWISDEFREKFNDSDLNDVADVKGGITTGSNERYLRFWWEVNQSDISSNYADDQLKWVGYVKGGGYNKWYGNNWLKVLWEKNGDSLKESSKSVMRNQSYYFKEGITYSATSSKGVSFRILEKNYIFDAKGSSVFSKNSKDSDFVICSILNSKLADYIINCLNSTVETQVGDIKRIPIPNM